jgi:hypothetical protein
MLILSASALKQLSPSLNKAKSYLYVREQQPNRSFEIDLWNKYVHNRLGDPYCAAFVSYCTDGQPVKSGLARAHAKGKFHTIGEVLRKSYIVKPGDKIIWARGNTLKGHIGLVLDWKFDKGTTIEANTAA